MLDYDKMSINAHVQIRQLEEMLEAVDTQSNSAEQQTIKWQLNNAVDSIKVAINEMNNIEAGRANVKSQWDASEYFTRS